MRIIHYLSHVTKGIVTAVHFDPGLTEVLVQRIEEVPESRSVPLDIFVSHQLHDRCRQGRDVLRFR